MSRATPRRAAAGLVMIDMSVVPGSPAGSCVRTILCGVAQRVPVTLLSADWDHPPEAASVDFLPVAAPRRPVLWRYLMFHARVASKLASWLPARQQPLLIQATQGQWVGADICYAHFCHGAYVKTLWQERRWLDARFWSRMGTHLFNAWAERRAFAKAQVIVAPSQGLQRELMAHYGIDASRIEVLANPVDTGRFRRDAAGFDRGALRASHGLGADDIVLTFMALGDFERKGLGLLLQALSTLQGRSGVNRLKLLVIGGQAPEIARFQAVAEAQGVGHHVRFVGLQKDVRPFLWASDGYAFPSAYEIFSLAILQAAAAGLPVMVTQGLYGAEEFVRHGDNGWQVTRDAVAIAQALAEIAEGRWDLAAMGAAARASVAPYSVEAFVSRWIALYRRLGLEVSGD